MTDDERDALIEKAAEAMVEYDNPGVYERGDVIADWDDYVGAARATFAVFEQAQAATAHPAHSGHEYGGGYARAAALAAGDPDWMNATGGTPTAHECTWACWVDRYGQDHHTPTVDERERIEQSNDIAYTVIEVAQNKAPEEFVTLDFRYGIADALWDAGYRKTRRTVQGEPTDAQVLAALNAYYADYMIGPNKSLSEVRPPRTVHDMRAALRAAYETKGEGR